MLLPQDIWDDIWKLHKRIILYFVSSLCLVLPAVTELPPSLEALLPKARAIDTQLYYSLNKFNHKSCRAGDRNGVCMFVWECMKTGGKHGGMCVDGFMFGSCCTHDEIDAADSSSSAIVPSYTSPSSILSSSSTASHNIIMSNSLVSSVTSKPYYDRPSQRPGLLNPAISPSSSLFDVVSSPSYFSSPSSILASTVLHLLNNPPGKEYVTLSSIVGGEPETATQPFTDTATSKWSQPPPPITIVPPEAPTRPTRPPKPPKPLRPALDSWWAYANKVKKPTDSKITLLTTSEGTTASTTTTTTTSTTTATTPEPTTTVAVTTTSTTKPPASGPFTTNVHSKHICGIPRMSPQPEGRIVNGTNSRYGEFPWQTSVRRTSFFGFSSTHRCGGALLNSRWVATAGHCVDDLLTTQIRLRVGEYDFSSVLEPYPYVEKKAKKKVVHPNYNFYTYEYDLALVEMEEDVEFQPHIQPICLPGNEDLLIGETARVTGWGRLSEHGTLPSILQQTSVPIMSNDACQKLFLQGGRKEHIPDIFLCAGYEKGGRDSCQGDSGGPLQVKGADGRWFLAGIISWGIGCAEPNLPGVCTRISKFVPFILRHVT